MESGEQKKSWYQIVNGEKVEVSQAVYEMIRSENNQIRNRALSEKRCAQASYRHCGGDCWNCIWQTNGRFESFEDSYAERNLSCASGDDVEATAMMRITLESIFKKADEVVSDGTAILHMYFEEGRTYREIACELGVSFVAISKRIDKLTAYFQKHKNLFQ